MLSYNYPFCTKTLFTKSGYSQHISHYIPSSNICTVAIKRNATTHFLTLKAYNSLATYARTIILYLF